MKTVKSLLLGAAAGLVAVAGAQAADMPVKAKPVQYVKICSLYGDGFYYIPGTDTCLKLGGYLRFQTDWGAGGGGIVQGSGGTMIRQAKYNRQETNDINYRVRAVISLDVRQQTEYGPLRTYIRAGWQQTTPQLTGAGTSPCNNATANACLGYWNRAFIQFAGFTVGRAQSFFDIFTYGGQWSFMNVRTSGDTGAAGADVLGYTAQFGYGFSGTLSLEDPNGHNKANTFDISRAGFFAINGGSSNDNAFNQQGTVVSNNGSRLPDIIANLRVDQAWGYVGVSAAIHDASGAYFLEPDNVANGHPADKLGWAAAAGFQVRLPGGDGVGANFVYSKGAAGFATNAGNWQIYNASTSVGAGWLSDGIFGPGLEVELTQVWSVNAGYQHIWNRKWRTSFHGGYVNINYNDAAAGFLNSALPAASVCVRTVAGVVGNFTAAAGPINQMIPGAGNSCNPDFSFYQIGTRTQWNPVPQLDIGLDVVYTHLNTAYKGAALYGPNAPRPTVTLIDDQNVWSALFRWQRNFYP
jgi:hypothetical protein